MMNFSADKAEILRPALTSFPNLSLSDVVVSQGKFLPRWETEGAIYHVTFHLADSVPREQLEVWRSERTRLTSIAKKEGRPLSVGEISEMREVFNERVEKYLTAGHGECLLRRATAAAALQAVLEHSNGSLYVLHEWCIMPNHVHIIVGNFTPARPMQDILAVWKRVAAHRINHVLARDGSVWHLDAYTRIIRNEEEYRRQLEYVWHNPDAAGLADGYLRKRYVP